MKFLMTILLASCTQLLVYGQTTWNLDNLHSNVRFEVGWQEFSVRTGEFKSFEGTLQTKSLEDLVDAQFEFKVDPASIDVIADRLADHLKGDRFLEVEKYPEITFKSSELVAKDEDEYTVKGLLKIHGIEKEQDVKMMMKGFSDAKGKRSMGFQVELLLNRKDFGLDWGSPRLGETVTIVGHLIYVTKLDEE